jgi:hypothetical protein
MITPEGGWTHDQWTNAARGCERLREAARGSERLRMPIGCASCEYLCAALFELRMGALGSARAAQCVCKAVC